MSNLDKLISHFEKFPGVGARQAKRFAFHLLTYPEADTREIADLIGNLKGTVTECHRCHRFFASQSVTDIHCSICGDPNRDQTTLAIVASDNDITPIERSGVYNGLYFVLGGMVPLLDKSDQPQLRGSSLKGQLPDFVAAGLTEIILAFAVNPDGENTGRFVTTLLAEHIAEHNLTIATLGRGLSTGSELEYADPDTIKNALTNRS